ncbi:hypothetical protein RB195_002502 [Necator americanus]|uniref:Uncharacterized protein n=1 Tax=Necator americanus TaxID=51031 RepID=A0ABR1DJN4_NECAM
MWSDGACTANYYNGQQLYASGEIERRENCQEIRSTAWRPRLTMREHLIYYLVRRDSAFLQRLRQFSFSVILKRAD